MEPFRAARPSAHSPLWASRSAILLLRTNLSKEQEDKCIFGSCADRAVKIYHRYRALADESPVNLEAAIRLKGLD